MSCPALIYSVLGRWLHTGSQTRSPNFHAEQRKFMCLLELCVAEEWLGDHQVPSQKDKLIHKAAGEAGSSFGPWPLFFAFLAFHLHSYFDEEAQTISPFILSGGIRNILPASLIGKLGKFSLTPCSQAKILETYICLFWLLSSETAVVRGDLMFSVISRSWHGMDTQATFLSVLPWWREAHSIDKETCAMQWTHKMNIFSQYVFFHSAPASRKVTTYTSIYITIYIQCLLRNSHLS